MKPFNPDQTKESTPEEIHREFMTPFNELEIENIFNNIKYKTVDKRILGDFNYKKKLSKELFFEIEASIESINDDKVLDQFLFFIHSTKTEIDMARLEFNKRKSIHNGENYFDMRHRDVHSKAQGVSGSDLLNKAFDFLKILKKNDHLDSAKVGCGVSQISVFKWLSKNNFKLNQFNQLNSNDIFNTETGELINPNFEYLKVLESHNNLIKDEYIINKAFRDDKDYPEYEKCFVKLNNEIYLDLGKDTRPTGDIISDLIDKKYIPRFFFEKEI